MEPRETKKMTTIEGSAKAIYEQFAKHNGGQWLAWEHQAPLAQAPWIRLARAGIEAMKIPSDAISTINGSKNWPLMIDAILREGAADEKV